MVNAAPSSTVLPLTSPFPGDIRLSRTLTHGYASQRLPLGLARDQAAHRDATSPQIFARAERISNYTDMAARLNALQGPAAPSPAQRIRRRGQRWWWRRQ